MTDMFEERARDQDLGPIIDALRAEGIFHEIANTGGWTMMVDVPCPTGVNGIVSQSEDGHYEVYFYPGDTHTGGPVECCDPELFGFWSVEGVLSHLRTYAARQWDMDAAVEYLTAEGDLATPGCLYGNHSSDCAPVAYVLALVVADSTDSEMGAELLHYCMGLVVNSHDDVESLLSDHARTVGWGFDVEHHDIYLIGEGK
jgi:hypothetical protein